MGFELTIYSLPYTCTVYMYSIHVQVHVYCYRSHLTKSTGQLPVYYDVSISSDGRCEVSVAWNVESIVGKVFLSLHRTSAEIVSQLHMTKTYGMCVH